MSKTDNNKISLFFEKYSKGLVDVVSFDSILKMGLLDESQTEYTKDFKKLSKKEQAILINI